MIFDEQELAARMVRYYETQKWVRINLIALTVWGFMSLVGIIVMFGGN